jgi:hypothetical protein
MTEAFTMEVMAMVLQELTELPEIPTLMMRTVIQAYSVHPRLAACVVNVLQHLVKKEVLSLTSSLPIIILFHRLFSSLS